MLYLLHGSDAYRRVTRVQEIREAYRAKYPEALGESLIDEETQEPLKTIASALTQGGGLFESKSLIIIRDVFSEHVKEVEELLESVAAHTREDMVVVLVVDRLPKSFPFTKKHATAEEFIPLNQARRVQWIARYIKQFAPPPGPGSISKKAAEALAAAIDDVGHLAQELEKLMAYCAGQKAIQEKDVHALFHTQIEETIFPISDGVAERTPHKALVAIARLVRREGDAAGLIGYTLKEARQLIRAHAAQSGELPGDPLALFGAKPFVWRKRTTQATRWTAEEIEELAQRCVELDASRRSGADARLALENFVLKAVPVIAAETPSS